MEGSGGSGSSSPLTEKRRAGIAKVKELWRQKRSGGKVDKKSWSIFLSSGRSFEELFVDSDSSENEDEHENENDEVTRRHRRRRRHDDQYWDPTWKRDENEERNRRRWEREERKREKEWQRKHEERKQAEREAFRLWSKRWDERNIALQNLTPRGRSPRSSLAPCSANTATATSEDQVVRERTSECERASGGDELGGRQDSSARFHFMFDELAPVCEEEQKREKRDKRARKARREWAMEVEAAEQRMEQGQSAVANSFKRRREQFYERRRSISDLSSDEHNVINNVQSAGVQFHISLTVTPALDITPPRACHSQTSRRVETAGEACWPSSCDDRAVITTGTEPKTTSGDDEKSRGDNGKKQEKKGRKGSFRLPSFRRSNRQTPGDARPAASADSAATKTSRVGAAGDQPIPRVRLRRVLSSDLITTAAN